MWGETFRLCSHAPFRIDLLKTRREAYCATLKGQEYFLANVVFIFDLPSSLLIMFKMNIQSRD